MGGRTGLAVGAQDFQARTEQLVGWFERSFSELLGGRTAVTSVDDVVKLENLTTDTIRLLRENKRLCLQESEVAQSSPSRVLHVIGGRGSGAAAETEKSLEGSSGDHRYDQAKRNIDQVIAVLERTKDELRDAKFELAPDASDDPVDGVLRYASEVSVPKRDDRSTGPDLADDLATLAAPHESGALTAEEFTAAKAELLT